jgi:hypothetical protein
MPTSSSPTKTCRDCQTLKPAADFSTCSKMRDKLHTYCRVCAGVRLRKWHHENPTKVYAYARKKTLKQYGLTDDSYDAMLLSQDGVCAICHQPNANGSKLAVDHCHVTGDVRALLCSECSLGLGKFADSQDRLRAAAAYLKLHQPAHQETIDGS